MPFKKRKVATTDLAERLPMGTWKGCFVNQCPVRGTVTCSYVDRKGDACDTLWCETHARTVRERRYCRRHASIAAALENEVYFHMLPSVDNRAPSLVNWVSRELDEAIRGQLGSLAPHLVTEVSSSAVRPGLERSGHIYGWLRNWKLSGQQGTIASVSLEVEEKDDCAVIVKVNNEILGRRLPPWIGRDTNEVLSSDQDAAAREAFRAKLLGDVEKGLESVQSSLQVEVAGGAAFVN